MQNFSFKRILSLILAALLIFTAVIGLAACKNRKNGDNETSTTPNGDGTTTSFTEDDTPENDNPLLKAILAFMQGGSVNFEYNEGEDSIHILGADTQLKYSNYLDFENLNLAHQVFTKVAGEEYLDGGLYISTEDVVIDLRPILDEVYGMNFENFGERFPESALYDVIIAFAAGYLEMEPEELKSLIPDFDVLQSLITKYTEVIGEELSKIPAETGTAQILLDGKTVSTTTTTYTVTTETVQTIIRNIFTRAASDDELKEFLEPYWPYIGPRETVDPTGGEKGEIEPAVRDMDDVLSELAEFELDAYINVVVTTYERSVEKDFVKLVINAEVSYEIDEDLYDDENELITSGAHLDLDFTLGSEVQSLEFTFSEINSAVEEEELESISGSITNTINSFDAETLSLDMETVFEVHFIAEKEINGSLHINVNSREDIEAAFTMTVLDGDKKTASVDAGVSLSLNPDNGAFDFDMDLTIGKLAEEYDGEESFEEATTSFNLTNEVETRTEGAYKGKLSATYTMVVGDKENTITVDCAYDLTWNVENGAFDLKADIVYNTGIAHPESGEPLDKTCSVNLKNEVETCKDGAYKGKLSFDLETTDSSVDIYDEEVEVIESKDTTSLECAYDLTWNTENGEFDFALTVNSVTRSYENGDIVHNAENAFALEIQNEVTENSDNAAKGTLSVSFVPPAAVPGSETKMIFALEYDYNKNSGDFTLTGSYKTALTADGETEVVDGGYVTVSGNVRISDTEFALSFSNVSYKFGEMEEEVSGVFDLKLSVTTNGTAPEVPEYKDLLDMSEDELNDLIDKITSLFNDEDDMR